MKYTVLLIIAYLLCSCNSKTANIQSSTKETNSKLLELQQLMLGTFVIYSEEADEHLKQYNVTGTDSVVLYSVAINSKDQESCWIYSYEFMTSLPNEPTYTSIKQIKKTHQDTFQVLYYNIPLKVNLKQVLTKGFLDKNIDLSTIVSQEKVVTYTSDEARKFVGKSIVYEDKDCHCLRQNRYDIDDETYGVTTEFFSKKDHAKLDIPKRPNLLLRRQIDTTTLWTIANKEYNVIDE